ncbi:MAG: sugar transferase [Rhizobiaceae bacterium]
MNSDEMPVAPPAPRPAYEASKRIFDIVFSLIGIAIALPVLLAIALALRFSSPDPVLYRGVRTGLAGVPFSILKFRTMAVGSDAGAGTTSRNDPRVTRLGRFLRRYKIDELPQLFNVLRGEMSFVGPRPELPRYTALYRGDEKLILTVRPGITDYSSIVFSDLGTLIGDADPDREFETKVLPEKNRLRIRYVRERGFWLDLKLIAATFVRIVRPR